MDEKKKRLEKMKSLMEIMKEEDEYRIKNNLPPLYGTEKEEEEEN